MFCLAGGRAAVSGPALAAPGSCLHRPGWAMAMTMHNYGHNAEKIHRLASIPLDYLDQKWKFMLGVLIERIGSAIFGTDLAEFFASLSTCGQCQQLSLCMTYILCMHVTQIRSKKQLSTKCVFPRMYSCITADKSQYAKSAKVFICIKVKS